MSTNVPIPPLGESVSEAVLLRWLRNDGDVVAAGDPLAELETDKANVDLPAPVPGVLRRVKEAGETVQIGETVARIDAAPAGAKPTPAAPKSGASSTTPTPPPLPPAQAQTTPAKDTGTAGFVPSGGGHAAQTAAASMKPASVEDLSPAVRRMVEENKLDPAAIPPSGPGGRLTK